MSNEFRERALYEGIDKAVGLFKTIVYAAVIVFIGSYICDIFIAFAGKQTDASISFQIITRLGASKWFAYFVGALGGGYGLSERQLRRSNIKRMRGQTSMLEMRMDPNRVSSGLTPEGRTQRGDA